MKMVELMAKMVQQTRRETGSIVIGFNVVPQFLTASQKRALHVDIIPIPLGLRYFSPGEVAILFQIHRRTVNRWAEKGWIQAYRPYQNVTYYKGYELFEVDRYINIVAR